MNGSGKVDAFPTPSFLSVGSDTGLNLDVSAVFPAIFAVVFFIWVAYTLVVAYHWLRYGHQSFVAIPMLVLHVVISGALMLITTAGLK